MTSTGEGPSATGSSSISANTSQISLADQFARSTEEEIQFALDEIRWVREASSDFLASLGYKTIYDYVP